MAGECRFPGVLSMGRILKFLDCNIESRCFTEGERIVNAKHVILAGSTKVTATEMEIVALCVRSSGIFRDPHLVMITLSHENGIAKISSCSCSCVAGKSEKCKHSAAVLLYCYRVGLASLDQLSCTDVECYWSSRKKDVADAYKAVPLQEFCHVNVRDAVLQPAFDAAETRDILLAACPRSALLQHRDRMRQQRVHQQAVHQQASATGIPAPLVEIVRQGAAEGRAAQEVLTCIYETYRTQDGRDVIEKSTRGQATVQLWHDYRKGMVTASIAHTVMTRSTTLLRDRLPSTLEGLMTVLLRAKSVQTHAMKQGSEKEPVAVSCYVRQLKADGHKPTVCPAGLVMYSEAPFIGCSPDGIVSFECSCCEGKKVLLEVKCPLKLENAFSNPQLTALKRQYQTQVNVQMGVCRIPRTHFFVFVDGSNNHLTEICFDETKFRQFLAPVTEVYTQHILPELMSRVSKP